MAVAVCMTSLIMLQARSKPFRSQSRPSELSLGRWENITFYARKRAQPGLLCLGVRLGPVDCRLLAAHAISVLACALDISFSLRVTHQLMI